MAGLFTRMTAKFLRFATTLKTYAPRIFAFARSMALLLAVMGAASEKPTTRFATAHVAEPAWLMFERFLAAHARFLGQEWTLWTDFIVSMAVVWDLRMAADFCSLAIIPARRCFGSTR